MYDYGYGPERGSFVFLKNQNFIDFRKPSLDDAGALIRHLERSFSIAAILLARTRLPTLANR